MKKPLIIAPLNVITGTLGAGKTLFAIEQADLLLKNKLADRVYQIGINGADTRKLPVLPFPIEEWAIRADRGELKNTVIIVDEFHKWMPQRGPGRPPKWIEEMAESRRRDVRWILLTQSGEFDHFLKGTRLNKHFHLSRKGFMARSTIFEWSERFVGNPAENKEARKEAIVSNWWHPKKYYDWYESASAHRFRVRLPLRIWALLIIVPAILWFGFRGARTMSSMVAGSTHLAAPPKVDQVSLSGSSSTAGASSEQGTRIQATTDPGKYLAQFQPVVPYMPWSAPVYQGRDVVAKPEIYCMSVGQDGQDGCHCYSEQATKLSVPIEICRSVAREGVYNPYRDPLQPGVAVASSDAAQAPSAAPATAAISAAERGQGTFPESKPYESSLPSASL
ncbi:zonular occludens toxin domain-containing protein [Xanthomonas massiliensis]|uniref:zonular occludens toxin domain-containing protein n=1 Tax=Xanthomonas massiliensis TaxID=1720302 RepID=UPI00098F1EC6|nr:zonular occludens toxin domain-containing protein [Xanthomonas massiliensis]